MQRLLAEALGTACTADKNMIIASVCSGVGGAELAFQGLAHCAWASETEAFPRAVLRHRFPNLTIHGDFRDIETSEPVDVLVGGTPCQSFSVAGLRRGMEDERGNLALEYLRLVDRLRPTWVVWENVPGVLSSNDGWDFGAFVGGLAECGYGWAYRCLDAQHFGLAQRRQRVFVVGCAGDWRRAAAVLFEPASLRGHPAPRREAGERTAPTLAGCSNGGGANGPGRDADTADSLVAPTLPARTTAGGGLGTDFDCDGGLIAFDARQSDAMRSSSEGPRLLQSALHPVQGRSLVRRLTPLEAERLQGFPDNWTLIPWRGGMASDGPRYRAIGNAFAVPVVRWIARRIAREHADLKRYGSKPAPPRSGGKAKAVIS